MVEVALRRTLPSWVEADPLRGRALDALGLQVTADRIADEILPGLSVLTNRARYYALLAWARGVCGTRADEHRIHRIEVALAVCESHLHAAPASDDSSSSRCRFVGSRNLSGPRFASPPSDPRDAYRVPVWRAYRASMRSVGLLGQDDRLTDDGLSLARRFVAACRPKDSSGRTMLPERACLSAMAAHEATLLEGVLGIRRRGKPAADDTSHAGRRAALERELKSTFDDGLSVPEVLATYESNRAREPSRTVRALREAAVWERLSVGLHAIFLLWLHDIHRPSNVARMVRAARRTRVSGWAPFEDIVIDDRAAANAMRSIRQALTGRTRLSHKGGLIHCDETAFELGELVVSAASPIDEVLWRLEARHLEAKGDDAWLREGRRGRELARDADDKWKLPRAATLHGYRLGAFGQILLDLRRARWGRS